MTFDVQKIKIYIACAEDNFPPSFKFLVGYLNVYFSIN